MSRWLLKLAFFNWLKSRNCIKIGPKCILLLPITRDVVATPCPTLLLFHPGLGPAMAESKMHKLHKFWIFNRLMLMTPNRCLLCRSTYQKSYKTLSLNAGWVSYLFLKKQHSFLLQFEHFSKDWGSAHWSIMELQFFTNLMPTLFFSPGRCCLVEAEKRNHSVDLLLFLRL